MNNIAIVVPCFKRVHTLQELLDSLLKANYGGDKVSLVFSIDYSGSKSVEELANEFKWPFGEKRIIAHSKNIGLRNNILYCGDLTNDYDAVIVIEDDLEVAQSFYQFAKQAAEFYDNDDKIGGVSIYNYYMDEMSWNPFIPISEGYDVTFIRWASSWGQLWTRHQWAAFRKWLDTHEDISNINVPLKVRNWQRSWKKYYIAYLTDTDRYFIFPTKSYILNANKVGGEHLHYSAKVLTSSPFNYYNQTEFRFQPFVESKYRYDAYFQLVIDTISYEGKTYDAELDIFGFKDSFDKEYVVTSRPCRQEDIICTYDQAMIPYELNILTNRYGKGFSLVKTSAVPTQKAYRASMTLIPDTIWHEDLKKGFGKLKESIIERFKKIL